jgi:hypothetical protein
MTQPTPYRRGYDFSDAGGAQPPGGPLDDELDDVGLTLSQILRNMALLQRDDTGLRNGIVGIDALDGRVLGLISGGTFSIAGTWATGTPYPAGAFLTDDGAIYLVMEAHTSTSIVDDLAAGRIAKALQNEQGTRLRDDFVGNAVQTEFSLSQSPARPTDVEVYVDGALVLPDDYVQTGATVTFDVAPANGAKISVFSITWATAPPIQTLVDAVGDRNIEISAATQFLADVGDGAPGKGASLIATEGLGDVQSDLDARPTTAALASSSGGNMIGLADGTILQTAVDQRPASDIRAVLGGDGAIKPVLEAMKAAGVLKAYLGPGSYTLDPGFDMGNMWLDAHPDAVITGTGATGGTNSLLSSTGSLTALPALSVDPVKGAMTLTYGSAHDLAPGDVINLYNPTNQSWAVFNNIYRAGEWCEVAAVISPTVLLLASPLYDSYAAADLEIYKAGLNRPMVTGGRWFVGDRYFTNFHMCGGGMVDVPFVDADSSTAINLDRCWSPVVRLGTLINRGASSTDDYGVAFGNSQHGRLYAKSIHARRHAVAHGGRDDVGAVPCRDCLTFGAILTNDYSTNVEAADMHGNAELCGFVECNIVGGAKLGGLSPIYRGCTVSAASGGVIARAAQFLGGTVDLRGLQGSTPATVNVPLGFISIVGQDDALTADTKADLNLILTDARISAPNISANQFIVRVKNNGFTGNVNLNIDRLALDLPAQTVEIVRSELASGSANSKGFIIDNFSGLPAGSALHNSLSSAYTNVPHRLKPVKAYWDGVTAGAASVTSGNISLPYVFPRIPTDVTLTLGVASGALDPMAGGTAVAVPYRAGMTASVINVGLRSANNAALGAAYSFRLSYAVGIRDF